MYLHYYVVKEVVKNIQPLYNSIMSVIYIKFNLYKHKNNQISLSLLTTDGSLHSTKKYYDKGFCLGNIL